MGTQEHHGDEEAFAIRMTGVVKRYGSRQVLDEIDLAVARGEIFALLGANGAGKTTTVEILTTLLRPDGGSTQVAGWDVATHPDEVRRRIALTGQSAAVDDVLTGQENLVMVARLCGLSRRRARSRAAELLEQFALTDAGARRAGTYSGGMRRRLDLALSFVVRPEVLFLDEPTTGLDARSRRELWQVIRSLRDAGTTVLLTTQYLEEADELADRIAVLNGGRIVATGTPAELKARVGDESVEVRDADGSLRGRIPTDGSLSAVRAAIDELVTAGIDGTVVLRRPTLDEVFFTLTESPSPHDLHDRMPA
ncbi:ABC-2 type transport system ATP-binding protein [Microbacterium sp. AK009]|uniref:ATP-binding cassette domain-containing protein n=1 Tax=Microbacterium sp. AK009 TaxID=2723068 RepID=UPI0015C7CBD6|nr:ATP-binding cassette domain-containing protein [Microbacterium sp. AK009]NYF17812.1 ABC-2 type transport system ATP-binding protein [Microbacterium sp. AK009]